MTSYYDLFAGGKSPRRRPLTHGDNPDPRPRRPRPSRNPELCNFPSAISQSRRTSGGFTLREVEIADWQTTVKLDGSRWS